LKGEVMSVKEAGAPQEIATQDSRGKTRVFNLVYRAFFVRDEDQPTVSCDIRLGDFKEGGVLSPASGHGRTKSEAYQNLLGTLPGKVVVLRVGMRFRDEIAVTTILSA
jgi:hypothetical protein